MQALRGGRQRRERRITREWAAPEYARQSLCALRVSSTGVRSEERHREAPTDWVTWNTMR